ncbi:unnamed protein product, partial [Symbiodinium sp. CCMP2592]
CLKQEEGELQEEATTSSKDLLSEYVLGAWSQPEEDRGGDKVRGLNLKRMEAGTRPEHFSSTNIGSEVRGLNSNRKLKLKKTEVWKFKLKKTQAWKLKLKKGKDKVRGLSPKKATRCVLSRTRPAQYGVPGAWSQPEEGGGGDEAGAGVPGACSAGTRPEGTRPERLSSTNVESQVRDLGEGGDEGGALILNRYGVLGACPTAACISARCLKPEEGELQEEATTSSKDLLSEYVPGAWSQPEEDRGGDKAGVPILNQYGVPGAQSQLEEDGGGNQRQRQGGKAYPQPVWGSEVRGLSRRRRRQGRGRSTYPHPIWGPRRVVSARRRRRRGRGGDEAGALILDQRGVPGTRSRPEEGEGGDEGGALILNRYGVLGACPTAACISARCLKPEEGELQEEATTSSKDLLSEYVLGAWSQPEEDRGSWSGENRSRDQAGVRGLNLKRMEAGTRPEHFSSTNIGSEVRGLNSNRKLKLKKTEVWKFKLKKTQAWKLKLKKGKDKVRILKKKKAGSGNEAVQARLHGAWSQSKKAEAGTRPAQYGVPGAWSQPEEGGGGDEAGTRPERLSSTNVESQVRDLGPKKVKVGCLKPEEGELQEEATTGSKDLLSEYVLGAWSQPEEDGGGDKAGVPILKQYGVPGARSQLEEDGGGNQDGGEERPEYLCKDKAGRAHPQPTWGSEVRKFKRKKTQVGKFKLKKTE